MKCIYCKIHTDREVCSECREMEGIMTLFEKLDAARRILGHTVEEAVGVLGVHRQSWFKWRGGVIPEGKRAEAVDVYISKGWKRMRKYINS